MNRGTDGEDREAERRRVIQTRVASGTERIQRLRAEVDASDNVVQERVDRHLEEAEMAAHELSARALDIPSRGSHQRRDLERALRSLELEIEFVDAKLEAAQDEERDDLRGMLHAEMRAMTAQTSVLSTMLGGRAGE
jgi:hypothetical protein